MFLRFLETRFLYAACSVTLHSGTQTPQAYHIVHLEEAKAGSFTGTVKSLDELHSIFLRDWESKAPEDKLIEVVVHSFPDDIV